MNCPNCNETLVMSDRNGVEIDYCPKCRGVWLDRGELDKIIERSNAYFASQEGSQQAPQNQPAQPVPPPQQQQPYNDDYYKKDRYYGDKHYNDPYYRHKKKKGFLGDFFDFD
ncbi:zf-TFIIB domain-containing protein [Flavisolibacter sp. BT320]|nr:zf-TFIIB domain-containing protein [Flavisolibacter longurius]